LPRLFNEDFGELVKATNAKPISHEKYVEYDRIFAANVNDIWRRVLVCSSVLIKYQFNRLKID
jgi:hypothetical protein